jgi:hypothetical protein
MSESRRLACNEWFDGTLYSRLNDKTTGAIVIVMQRLHQDDLVGHLLKREGWEIVSFPAIAEVDERHVVETAFGRKEFLRRTGEALHSTRESLETLAQIRSAIGEYNFAGQYQQSPAPAGGGMVKEVWFHRYNAPGNCPYREHYGGERRRIPGAGRRLLRGRPCGRFFNKLRAFSGSHGRRSAFASRIRILRLSSSLRLGSASTNSGKASGWQARLRGTRSPGA